MPVVIEDLASPIGLLDREIGPFADRVDLGSKVADLEARVQALERAIGLDGDSAEIRAARIVIRAEEEIQIQTPTSSITLGPQGISIQAPGGVQISGGRVSVETSAASFNTGMCTYSGVVKCDTLITNTVIAAVYTPGVGNIQ